jgi:hypothetical protein
MANCWVQVENNAVVECLDYNPQREGDWREAVHAPTNLITNRQVLDGHWFDISKTPVEIVWNIKDLTLDDRKQSVLQQVTYPMFHSVENELQKEIVCTCSDDIGCCTETITEKLNEIKQKRAEILALSTHDEIDQYMTANGLE